MSTAIIGQQVYDGSRAYTTPLAFKGQVLQPALLTTETQYRYLDPCLLLDKTSDNSTFEDTEIYYLRFCVRRTNKFYNNVELLLHDTDNKIEDYLIKTFTVQKVMNKDANEYEVIEAIFKPPGQNYNSIIMSVNRDKLDANQERDIDDLNSLIFQELWDGEHTGNFSVEDNDKNIRGFMELNFAPGQEEREEFLEKNPTTNEISVNNLDPSFLFTYVGSNQQQQLQEYQCKIKMWVEQENNSYKLHLIPDNSTEKATFSLTQTANTMSRLTSNKPSNNIKTSWDIQNFKEETFQGNWLPVYYYDNKTIIDNPHLQSMNIRLEKIIPLNTNLNGEYFKIGLQAQPGFMFTLDGEELKVGPTGIYQIEYDDLKISKIGIVPPSSGSKFFILDYKIRQ